MCDVFFRIQNVDSNTVELAYSLLEKFPTVAYSWSRGNDFRNYHEVQVAVKVYMLIIELYVSNCGDTSQDMMSHFHMQLRQTLQDFKTAVAATPEKITPEEIKVILQHIDLVISFYLDFYYHYF